MSDDDQLAQDRKDTWNELWNAVYDVHYRCYFEELCAEFLVSRWRLWDTISKFLTAATASGSAIAAWTVWATSSVTSLTWALISGVAAFLALLHTSLGISDRIKEGTLIFSTFQQLRLDLESFQLKMKLRQHDTLASFLTDYMDIRSKFGKSYVLKGPDFMLTEKRADLIQKQLNRALGY